MAPTKAEGLNVIALVSGGKDSFFSLLHCRANGHRIVALANLHPPLPRRQCSCDGTSQPQLDSNVTAVEGPSSVFSSPALELTPCSPCGGPHLGSGKDARLLTVLPGREGGVAGNETSPEADEDEQDLNSFMYQTVGHQVIPLYAEATGIPLYRRVITGAAVQHGRDYYARRHRNASASAAGGYSDAAGDPEVADPDETESMVPLLQDIKKAHPEANAICAGAILSTYQRTRVESVAIRLGLTPLAYLWKFPILPAAGPSGPVAGTDAQLLDDMMAAGLEPRIVKVASGGLDDSFLWTNIASPTGKARVAAAMRRFGPAETGAVIGEGGEFETIVLDGPPVLFQKRIVVAEEDRRVIREGGGSAWLSLRNARLEDKPTGKEDGVNIRIPNLLDPGFVRVLDALSGSENHSEPQTSSHTPDDNLPELGTLQPSGQGRLEQWSFTSGKPASASIEAETRAIVEHIRRRLQERSLPASAILNATVVLRRMADFPAVNSIYNTLFDAPNPPSRVTISCGDAAGTSIAIYLTVHNSLQPSQRHGLHVQSRSYWAPANIGPYSQAISVPLSSLGRTGEEVDATTASSSSGPRLVSIAGQIPLVPATMALPDSGDSSSGESDTLPLQLTLSLQHLWRIGVELGVQWWTSVMAYFPACRAEGEGEEEGEEEGPKRTEMVQKARMVGEAWRAAHLSNGKKQEGDEEDDNDDDDDGPDLWDRRFNPQYRTFSSLGGEERKEGPVLPDSSVLVSSSRGRKPPVFVAEVDELPRGAGVEWHAHLGIANAAEGSVLVRDAVVVEDKGDVRVMQTIIRPPWEGEKGVRFVQTVVAEGVNGGRSGEHGDVATRALAQLGAVDPTVELAAVVRYVDVEVLRAAGEQGVSREKNLGPVVPCRSLWDGNGKRLAAVSVYHSVFE
ncbi:hypothetical protein VTH82DRAFT_2680 [Thermothelomyces myriococcoides]